MKKYSFRHTIKQGIAGLFHICKEELKMTVKDQGVLIFFLLVPLAYPLVYAFIYTNEVVREVPVAVVDADRSSVSREYLRRVDGGPDVRIVSYCSDMEEARLLLKKQKIYGVVYVPEDFSRDLASGEQAHVSIFADMSGMLYYKALLLANTEASLEMNKDIQIRRAGNTTGRQDEITVRPIDYEAVSLYNPQDGFASFLIPAVLILIIQQTLLLGIGLSAGTARENNRFRDLVPWYAIIRVPSALFSGSPWLIFWSILPWRHISFVRCPRCSGWSFLLRQIHWQPLSCPTCWHAFSLPWHVHVSSGGVKTA